MCDIKCNLIYQNNLYSFKCFDKPKFSDNSNNSNNLTSSVFIPVFSISPIQFNQPFYNLQLFLNVDDDINKIFYDIFYKMQTVYYDTTVRDYSFEIHYNNYKFNNCIIRSINENFIFNTIEIINDNYDIIDQEKERFENYKYRIDDQRVLDIMKNIQKDEIKEINEELDLWLNDPDEYFERKLDGKLKYL